MNKEEIWRRTAPKQPFWRRRPVIAIATALALLATVFTVLLLKTKPATPKPAPKSIPISTPKPPPAPPSPMLKVPDELGGEVRATTLAKLYSAAPGLELNPGHHLSLRMTGQPRGATPHVTIGTPFPVTLVSSRPCYYALFHRDSSGKIEVAPRPKGSSKLDSGGDEVTSEADAPSGEQTFLLLCAEKPIKLDSVLSGDPQAYKNAFVATVLTYFAQEK